MLPLLDILQAIVDAEQDRIEREQDERERREARAEISRQSAELDVQQREVETEDREAKGFARDLYSQRAAALQANGREPDELKKARIQADLAKAAARTNKQSIAQARDQLSRLAREIGGEAAKVDFVMLHGEPCFRIAGVA